MQLASITYYSAIIDELCCKIIIPNISLDFMRLRLKDYVGMEKTKNDINSV